MLIAIGILICLLPISYFIGRKSYKNYIKNFFKTGKGKFGIIVYHSYSTVDHVIEVEEIESAGDLTKVRVVRVCSCVGDNDSTSKVLSSKSFNEWVPCKNITWYDDNSQRMRDEKLKQILGNQ
jgi:hypothetical protein